MFKALYADSITLHLINEDNLAEIAKRFRYDKSLVQVLY